MLETITVAMTAERDAHIQAKLAEHEEAMHALMRAHDEGNAALMRARDEENAAEIAELVKTFEGQVALIRSPVRSAGLNEGGAADSLGEGIVVTGSAVASPQLQAYIGVVAENLSLKFIGDAVNSKDEAKLNPLSPEPSSARIT